MTEKVDYSEWTSEQKSAELDRLARRESRKFVSSYAVAVEEILDRHPSLEPEADLPSLTRSPADRYDPDERELMLKIDEKVRALRFKDTTLTYEQALEKLLEDDPKLAKQYYDAQ